MHLRRSALLLAAIGLPLVVVACSNRRPDAAVNANVAIPETGVVVDLSERNGTAVFVQPGDVLLVNLKGDNVKYPRSQWSFRAPLTGNELTLKRHEAFIPDGASDQAGSFTAVWEFKVERASAFEIRLEYEQLGQRAPLETFSVYVVSDRSESETANILILSPQPEAVAKSPLVMHGYARTFEGTVRFRLRDEFGVVLTEGFTTATAGEPSSRRTFTQSITFSKPSTGRGSLEVFQDDAGTGGEIDTVIVPLVFDPTLTTVEVYFTNSQLDPEVSCTKVFAVKRSVPKSAAPAAAAIEKLLAGPSQNEFAAGYTTNIPTGAKVKRVSLVNGVMTADFAESLQFQVAGSCRVTAIRSQIEQTLRQFPGVTSVVISVDGKTEDILQP